jgi:FKBP-type peptidyl-prolyl cis-trans isomerase
MKKGKLSAISIPFLVLITGLMSGCSNFNNTSDNSGKTDADGYTVTESGLKYKDTVEGDGETATAGDTVSVHYTGTFEDGSQFDSSVGGTPFEFTVGEGYVIAGWDEGVQDMKVGGKRELVIPSDLGYGDYDYGPIPGGSTLYFEVELLEIL